MSTFLKVQRSQLDNNHCILPSERHISQPFKIFEDDTADPLFIAPRSYTIYAALQEQVDPNADRVNPWLTPQEIWQASYGTTTTHPARTWLTIELNEAVEVSRAIAESTTSFSYSTRLQNPRPHIFQRRLKIWIGKLEDRFCRNVCGWALRYVPEKPIFGLVTDFSRESVIEVYRKSRRITTGEIEAFKEILIALKLWACYNGIEIEPLTVHEAGGSTRQGVCNFAAICTAREGRPLSCPILERRTAWLEIMELTMEQWPEPIKIGVPAMVLNLLNDVLPKWKHSSSSRTQRRRARIIRRFIRAPRF